MKVYIKIVLLILFFGFHNQYFFAQSDNARYKSDVEAKGYKGKVKKVEKFENDVLQAIETFDKDGRIQSEYKITPFKTELFNTYKYSFDIDGKVLKIEKFLYNILICTTVFTYNKSKQLIKKINYSQSGEKAQEDTFYYDINNNNTTIHSVSYIPDIKECTIVKKYNKRNRIISESKYDVNNKLLSQRKFSYNSNGNCVKTSYMELTGRTIKVKRDLTFTYEQKERYKKYITKYSYDKNNKIKKEDSGTSTTIYTHYPFISESTVYSYKKLFSTEKYDSYGNIIENRHFNPKLSNIKYIYEYWE